MITHDLMRYAELRAGVRGMTLPQYDVFVWSLPAGATRYVTDGRRALYFLLTEELPLGTRLLSESSGVVVTPAWLASGAAPLTELTGQLALELPEAGALDHLAFLRVQSAAA